MASLIINNINSNNNNDNDRNSDSNSNNSNNNKALMFQISSSPISLAYQATDGLPHARLVELDILLKLPGCHLKIGGIRSLFN